MQSDRSNDSRLVMLVDDDGALLEALTDALVDAGFAVEGFTEPEAAIARLQHGPTPDALIVDYIMPQMDGEELARRVRSFGLEVPVLLLSGRERDPQSERGLPVRLVMQKPIRLEQLLDWLADVVTRPRAGYDSVATFSAAK